MARQWEWYVYIIECLDGTFYSGLTWNIQNRFEQHQSGRGGAYTAKHDVRRLAYAERHMDLEQARAREIQIKNWSQSKKLKLISGVWHQDWN